MELETIKIFSQVAGIGGISLGVFLILFRDIIRKNIFPNKFKNEELSYRLLRLIVIVIWSVAIVGIISWLYILKEGGKPPPPSPPEWNSYSLISCLDFDNINKEVNCQFDCGKDEVWNREVLNGQYWVENIADNSAIHYNFLNSTNVVGDWEKTIDLGPFNPFSVDITIAQGESEENLFYSGAGLLFRYHPNRYYLYIVNSFLEKK